MEILIIGVALIGFIQADKINLASTTTRNESSSLPSFNKRFEATDQSGTSSGALKRDKRFILFDGGGIVKTVLGILTPVETGDKVNWRAMNMGYNFQAQYAPLPSIIYPWQRYRRSIVDQREQYDRDGTFVSDMTRTFAYEAVELLLTRSGKNGKECLLRAICDAAKVPIRHVGLFDELFNLFLTPNENEVHSDYMDARLAGKYGADCSELYVECPLGHGLLDQISMFRK